MITVSIENKQIKEFQALRFTRSLESLCGQFEIQCLPSAALIRGISPGNRVTISYDGKTVFTGIVDAITSKLGGEEKSLSISGRECTSVLVDSSVIHNPMGFESASLKKLAEALCKPFKIGVISRLKKAKSHPNWYLFYGETVFESLSRMAKIDGALLMTSESGDLVLSHPTIETDAFVEIIEGVNLYEISATQSQRALYRNYEITTYAQGLGNSVGVVAPLEDRTIKLNKTLIIDSEGLPSNALALDRLEYEMRTRKARSYQLMTSVPGWVDLKGSVYKLNSLARVDAKSLSISGQFLISGLTFTLDKDQGYETEITLISPDAFIPDPASEVRLNTFFDLMRKDAQ